MAKRGTRGLFGHKLKWVASFGTSRMIAYLREKHAEELDPTQPDTIQAAGGIKERQGVVLKSLLDSFTDRPRPIAIARNRAIWLFMIFMLRVDRQGSMGIVSERILWRHKQRRKRD